MRTHALVVRSLEPPVDLPGFRKRGWFPVPEGDPVVTYLIDQVWDQPESPLAWAAARLSKSAYLYREKITEWTVLAKFYSVKVRSSAALHDAALEFQRTRQAEAFGWVNQAIQAPRALACTNGVLFLEYIDGLALDDDIAMRRYCSGRMLHAIEQTVHLLAGLHTQCPQPGFVCDFDTEIENMDQSVRVLAKKGVLKGNQVVVDTLQRQIARWAKDPAMIEYIPTYIHGNASTENFIFPWSGGLVAIDWERMRIADPASELGRLSAEVAHSIQQYHGEHDEVEQFLQLIRQTYCQALPSGWDAEALLCRERFYRASHLLRIACSNWLSSSERVKLVSQALSLLL